MADDAPDLGPLPALLRAMLRSADFVIITKVPPGFVARLLLRLFCRHVLVVGLPAPRT